MRAALYILIILSYFGDTEGCLFKPGHDVHGKWDDDDFTRDVDTSCECGLEGPTGTHPWNVYVIVFGNHSSTLACTGTLITTNLVLTSHECLEAPGKHFNVYDAWEPGKSINMVNITRVAVFTNHSLSEKGVGWFVSKVVYNSWFGTLSATKGPPQDDLVILELPEDFRIKAPFLAPICIQECYDRVENMVGSGAYHYGIVDYGIIHPSTTQRSTPEKNWNYFVNCSEDSSASRRIAGDIVPDKECFAALYNDETCVDNDYFICFKNDEVASPRIAGGQLILKSKSEDGKGRNFLVGVAAMQRLGTTGTKYVPFTEIFGMVRYIEHHARISSSRWCKSEPLVVSSDCQAENVTGKANPRSADNGQEWRTIEPRDESLQCVCGIENRDPAVPVPSLESFNVQPYQYPWVSYIRSFKDESDKVGEYCTGMVINNLMMVGSVRCAYTVDWTTKTIIQKPKIEIYIMAHTPSDPKAIRREVSQVIPHPSFKTYFVNGDSGDSYDPHNLRKSKDICLIVFNEPLDFASCGVGVRPICLPSADSAFHRGEEKRLALGIGWAHQDDTYTEQKPIPVQRSRPEKRGPGVERLQKMQMKTKNMEDCGGLIDDLHGLCRVMVDDDRPFNRAELGGLQIQLDAFTWTLLGAGYSDPHRFRSEYSRIPVRKFTSAHYLGRFINYHAHKLGAKWCQQPHK